MSPFLFVKNNEGFPILLLKERICTNVRGAEIAMKDI
jgi:hypothetical protein